MAEAPVSRIRATKAPKVRFRLDAYDARQGVSQYRPIPGYAQIVELTDLKLSPALWRAFVAWLESRKWEKDLTPEDRAAG